MWKLDHADCSWLFLLFGYLISIIERGRMELLGFGTNYCFQKFSLVVIISLFLRLRESPGFTESGRFEPWISRRSRLSGSRLYFIFHQIKSTRFT